MKKNLMKILNAHKASVMEMIEEENDTDLTQEIGAMHEHMITEVSELLELTSEVGITLNYKTK